MMLNLVPESIKSIVKTYINSYVDSKIQELKMTENPLEKSADMDVIMKQTLSILKHEHDFVAPPPKHLQVRVVGSYVAEFIQSGYGVVNDLNNALRVAGKSLKDFASILDFGCGCGRAIRAIKNVVPSCELYGTDIDEEAIAWLQQNYSKFAQFSHAPDLPPTVYQDDMFEFIFGVSVFTHLPEDMQFKWLEELHRITKPEGYLVMSFHGENHYQKHGDIRSIMEKKGFYYSDFGSNYGKSINLPDFYQTAFHTHDYIRQEWNKYFEVVDIRKLGMGNHQDTVLLRKR